LNDIITACALVARTKECRHRCRLPLTLPTARYSAFTALSGLSIDVETWASADRPRFRENTLFTHRGLSGPSILQISSVLKPRESFRINLLPGVDAKAFLMSHRMGGKDLKWALRQVLPERFVQAWLGPNAAPRPLAQLPQREIDTLATQLSGWELQPDGDEGYPKAEVTVGGVDTSALSSKTMECRDVKGLFFIGEVVDVTGWLGGYNFQWAWASAYAASQAV
jgi:predicted Rossmann fold flavoprotein